MFFKRYNLVVSENFQNECFQNVRKFYVFSNVHITKKLFIYKKVSFFNELDGNVSKTF